MVRRTFIHRGRILLMLTSALLLLASNASLQVVAQTTTTVAARTPTETVREFYQTLREKHFKEAFAMTIFKPALEGLSAEEFEDLRVDFERMAANVPEQIEFNGEQISGERATVFIKVPGTSASEQPDPVQLVRLNGAWIIGAKEDQEKVKQEGNKFFFNARINVHHAEAQAMLQRVNLAQIAYASQHNGLYADLPTLVAAGLLPKDIEATESTGYTFHLTLAKDAKSFTVGAEPARYGRTGRLSFFMDRTGVRSADVGGRPLIPGPVKK